VKTSTGRNKWPSGLAIVALLAGLAVSCGDDGSDDSAKLTSSERFPGAEPTDGSGVERGFSVQSTGEDEYTVRYAATSQPSGTFVLYNTDTALQEFSLFSDVADPTREPSFERISGPRFGPEGAAMAGQAATYRVVVPLGLDSEKYIICDSDLIECASLPR